MTVPKKRAESTHRLKGTSPVDVIVANLEGGPYFTITQVSEMLRIPVRTLRDWYRRGPDQGGTRATSLVHEHGELKIYLYTDDDLDELRTRRGPRTTKERTRT